MALGLHGRVMKASRPCFSTTEGQAASPGLPHPVSQQLLSCPTLATLGIYRIRRGKNNYGKIKQPTLGLGSEGKGQIQSFFKEARKKIPIITKQSSRLFSTSFHLNDPQQGQKKQSPKHERMSKHQWCDTRYMSWNILPMQLLRATLDQEPPCTKQWETAL